MLLLLLVPLKVLPCSPKQEERKEPVMAEQANCGVATAVVGRVPPDGRSQLTSITFLEMLVSRNYMF